MSARRGPPFPTKGGPPHGSLPQPPSHEPPFARGVGGMPHQHHSLHDDRMESHYSLGGHRQPSPHAAVFEERMAIQNDDIQILLVDNQRFAATHVALRQELELAQYELQRADKFAHTLHAEKDLQMRELLEKSGKMENELHVVNTMKAELMQVHMDIKELIAARQELSAQAQMMTQDLTRVTSDLQQIPAIKAEIDGLRNELEQARAGIEQQKKGIVDSIEHGKVMENNLVSMAREMEKLRAELAAAEKRARTAAATPVNQGMSYNTNYGVQQPGYPGNPYSAGYGMIPQNFIPPAPSGAEGYPQYGPGPVPGKMPVSGPVPGKMPGSGHVPGPAWGSQDIQQAQGPR